MTPANGNPGIRLSGQVYRYRYCTYINSRLADVIRFGIEFNDIPYVLQMMQLLNRIGHFYEDSFYAIPLSLDMRTGHFSRKDRMTSGIIHWSLFYLALLKFLHILYALVRLLIDFRPESFPTLILTFLWLSLPSIFAV